MVIVIFQLELSAILSDTVRFKNVQDSLHRAVINSINQHQTAKKLTVADIEEWDNSPKVLHSTGGHIEYCC